VGAQGTATLDFGAFPGKSDASVVVTGQAGIVAGSLVEAWIRPVATADHTDTEHMVETLKVFAADIVAGVGFTIYGFNSSQLNEPLEAVMNAQKAAATQSVPYDPQLPARGGRGTLLYGQWTVAWVWN
jgi:hypothetical protein